MFQPLDWSSCNESGTPSPSRSMSTRSLRLPPARKRSDADGDHIQGRNLRMEAQQPMDMMERMNAARALASAGKLDEATDAYVWLWEHMLEHEPAMLGVRASFMLA